MRALLEKGSERLLGLLPTPIFLALVVIVIIFGGFWIFAYRPELVPTEILLDPWFIAAALVVICFVVAYYVARYVRLRPKKTGPGRVGIWLAQLEGDARGSYLRDLKGQIEQELSPDPNLKDVEVSVYPHTLDTHEEAREVGFKLNAGGVVWGSLGRGLGGGRVSNLKLTVIGGPMNLQNDVQFRSEVDLGGYEMRDVTRFVAGYALLSSGKSTEAAVHFDRILDEPRPGLFELADALQFGGIASFLATQRSANSRELLEKARRYFAKYRDLWSENRDPLLRAMGFFNLGSVEYRLRGGSPESINVALELYAEATRLFDKAGGDEGYAMVQIEMAHIFSDLYQIHNEPAFGVRAHIYLEEASQFVSKEKNPYRYAKLMFERGRLFTRMGYGFTGLPMYFKDSAEAFEKAIEIYRTNGYSVETAIALLHWGGARIDMNGVGDEERKEVLYAYRQAASIATKEEFPTIYAEIQTSTCAALLDLPATASNVGAAVKAGEEALSIHTPEENAAEYARACICHAEACLAYSSLNEVPDDEAMRHLEDALRSADAVLKVVGPGFYPRYAGHAKRLAEKAKEQIEKLRTEA